MPNVVEIIVRATNEAGAVLASIETQTNRVQRNLTNAGLLGAAGLAAIAVESVKTAATFDSSVTRLVTSANESTKNISMISNGMLDMAPKVGFTANELAKGMYQVESAGYHGAEGLTVLKAAAQGAKDEGANLGKVANAVTDILIDYHLGADQAANVTSQMVKAVSFGKITFDQFSGSLANVLPTAAAVNLKFSDVAAVLATMTSHGMTAMRSSQNITNAIISLEKPTAVMTKEMGLFGITSADVNKKLSTTGLAGTMQWLSKVAQDGAGKVGQTYVGALGKLMGTAAGLKVALMTTGNYADYTNKAIAGIGKASADAQGNVEGFALVQKTFQFQLEQFRATINELSIRLGHELIPILQAIFGFIADHSSVFSKLAIAIAAVTIAFIAYTVAAKAAAIATALMNAELTLSPTGLIVVGILALAAGFIYLWNRFAGFRNFWVAAWNDIKTVAEIAWQGIQEVIQVVVAWIEPVLLGMVATAQDVMNLLRDIFTGNWSAIWSDVENLIADAMSTIAAYFYGLAAAAGTWLEAAGSNLVVGLWDGIASAAGWLYDQVAAFCQGVIDTVANAFGIHSPSVKMYNFGNALVQGLANGFSQGWKEFDQLLKDKLSAVDSALSAAQNRLSQAQDKIVSIASGVSDSTRITDRGTTFGAILTSYQTQASQASQFAADISQLKKMGLAQPILDQLGQAGLSALPQMQALISGGAGGISEINKLSASITASGTMAGKIIQADAIKAASAEVKTLTVQKLELASAIKIADKFAAEISKAATKHAGGGAHGGGAGGAGAGMGAAAAAALAGKLPHPLAISPHAAVHPAIAAAVHGGGGGSMFSGVGGAASSVGNATMSALTSSKNAIMSVLGSIGSAIKSAYQSVADALKPIFDSVAKWWSTHGEELITVVKFIVGVIWQVVRVTMDIIIGLFRVAWTLISNIVVFAWNVITQTIKAAWNIILPWLRLGLDMLVGAFKIAWAAIAGVVKIAWALIVSIVKIAWDTLVMIFSVFLDLVTGHWKRAWTDIKNWVTQVNNAISGFLRSFWNAIKGFLSATWSAIVSVAKSAWHNIADAMTAPVKQAWNLILGWVGDIKNAIGSVGSGIGNAGASAWNAITGAGHAFGGIVGAATGGPRSGLIMVGEHGRELIQSSPGSRVYSNPDTERMLRSSDSAWARTTLEVVGGESEVVELFTKVIRHIVRIKGGGSVQQAFGR